MATLTEHRRALRSPLLAALAVLLLAACSDAPSDHEIEALVQNRYAGRALMAKRYFGYDNNPFLLRDIKKTNGVKKGDNEYIAYVTFNYVATMSFAAWRLKVAAQGKNLDAELQTEIPYEIYSEVRDHQFQMGQSFPYQEQLTLVKTDRGWRLKGLESE